jgi:uncharacterized integral membrane protein
MRRLLAWIVGLPLAILLILLSVANRSPVRLSLDPFSGETPAYAIELPLFAIIFVALIVGLIIGGAATWFGQSRWRREARDRRLEANRLRAETDRLRRTGAPNQLALPPRA